MFNYDVNIGNFKYVDKGTWNKFSPLQKLKTNLKLSDFNQLPDRRKFSDQEKEEFLKEKKLLELKEFWKLPN